MSISGLSLVFSFTVLITDQHAVYSDAISLRNVRVIFTQHCGQYVSETLHVAREMITTALPNCCHNNEHL